MTRHNRTATDLKPSAAWLAGLFIFSLESQRIWNTPAGLPLLVGTVFLLGLWVLSRTGLKTLASHLEGALDIAILGLVMLCGLLSLNHDRSAATPLASAFVFWMPLIAARWGWRLGQKPVLMCITFAVCFCVPAAALWPSSSLLAHVLLSTITLVFSRTLTHQKSPEEHMRDSVTELASPDYLEAEIAQLCAISDRYGMPLSLVACRLQDGASMLDDDNLREATDRIAECIRLPDTASHWAPDVILVLLPNTDLQSARRVSQRIADTLLARPFNSGVKVTLHQSEIQHGKGEDPMLMVATLEEQLTRSLPLQHNA